MGSRTGNGTLPEVWGGIECTVNRVGDTYFEQLERLGHIDRPGDLELFAELGIKAIRYPVLWERVAPHGLDDADWDWTDRQLDRLRELAIRPIIGLVHHGSGPSDTSLTDPDFPKRLAVFADAVARRYPWLHDYTPVNEPLTTARFSALYGHWYPHYRDDRNFASALLNQARAVVLAMRAIRSVAPEARLIQTDDLGRTYSSPALQYQADFENERRWVTYDLLTGSLTEERPMWHWLRRAGVAAADLQWFLDNPCPPDILGFNTYLSSERYLDDRVEKYPCDKPGTNGTHTYVDILAARVLPESVTGTRGLLNEAWDRYGLPLAITEVHNGGDREEQLRWLDEVWRGAVAARQDGADVRAVTVWALLGLFDWPNLVTRQDNVYEPGVFDVRGLVPRPTAIARMVADLATKGEHRHPVLDIPGWWRRPDRFWYESDAMQGRPGPEALEQSPGTRSTCPVLVYGQRNELRLAIQEALASRVIPFVVVESHGERSPNLDRIRSAIRQIRPWAMIDAGVEHWYRWQAPGSVQLSRMTSPHLAVLATVCADHAVPLLSFSSDLVFDGHQSGPYLEDDVVLPVDDIGRSQAMSEIEAMRIHASTLIVRTGPMFGAPDSQVSTGNEWDERNAFASAQVVDSDEVVTPAHREDIVHAALDLLVDGERGIWHLSHGTSMSWEELNRALLGTGQDGGSDRLPPDARGRQIESDLPSRALQSEHGHLLPQLSLTIDRVLSHPSALSPH